MSFENEPTNAAWSERYFHIREPDGYQLSFAKSIDDKEKINLQNNVASDIFIICKVLYSICKY